MSVLTGPAPLPPILANPVAVAADGTPLVLTILAARAADRIGSLLAETLQTAAGPGNIISGTIAESAPDGTVTITTQNGTTLTFHHPPELPLDLGSTVVLRLLPNAQAPQAMLLSVNGRPMTSRGAAPPTGAAAAPAASSAVFRPPAAPAGTGTTSVAAAYLATISLEDETAIEAAISEDGLTLDAAPTGAGDDGIGESVVATLIRPAPAKLGQTAVPTGTRYLVSVRAIGAADLPVAAKAPPAGAAIPIASGLNAAAPAAAAPLPVSAAATILLALQAASGPPAAPADPPEDETAATPSEPAPAATRSAIDAVPLQPRPTAAAATIAAGPVPLPPTPATAPPPAPPATAEPAGVEPAPAPSVAAADHLAPPKDAQPADDAAFRPQILTLAGRVVAPRQPAETLIETAIGTLALPAPEPLPLGAAVQLRVTAVAAPLPPPRAAHTSDGPLLHGDPSPDGTPPSLIEELSQAVAGAGAAVAAELRAALVLEPGAGLAAAIFTFLAALGPAASTRPADLPGRKALLDTGRTDLAARLDHARADIGSVRPPDRPDGWTVTTLPFLGAASIRPLRLYRKRHQDKDDEGRPRGRPSDRFVLEVELKRMGPLQFDGLVRERRFDLVVRSREAFDPALQHLVEHAFQDGLLISGWSGEIGFGRTGKFPLQADPHSASHLDLGA